MPHKNDEDDLDLMMNLEVKRSCCISPVRIVLISSYQTKFGIRIFWDQFDIQAYSNSVEIHYLKVYGLHLDVLFTNFSFNFVIESNVGQY